MLKLMPYREGYYDSDQPPSGGCVLKHRIGDDSDEVAGQPPSGGCVLKRLQ